MQIHEVFPVFASSRLKLIENIEWDEIQICRQYFRCLDLQTIPPKAIINQVRSSETIQLESTFKLFVSFENN